MQYYTKKPSSLCHPLTLTMNNMETVTATTMKVHSIRQHNDHERNNKQLHLFFQCKQLSPVRQASDRLRTLFPPYWRNRVLCQSQGPLPTTHPAYGLERGRYRVDGHTSWTPVWCTVSVIIVCWADWTYTVQCAHPVCTDCYCMLLALICGVLCPVISLLFVLEEEFFTVLI